MRRSAWLWYVSHCVAFHMLFSVLLTFSFFLLCCDTKVRFLRKLVAEGSVSKDSRRRQSRQQSKASQRRTKQRPTGHGSRDKISTDFAGDSSLAAYFSEHAPQRERSDREITRF